VIVAYEVARALGAPLDVLVVRKIGVPGAEEFAMGATAAGSTLVDADLVRRLRIPPAVVDAIVRRETAEVHRREALYRGARAPLEVKGRTVLVVDDGLATGYTAIAASRMVRKHLPRSVVLAVPVATAQTLQFVEPEFDQVHCLISQDSSPFAVASFYRHFPDLGDAEVQTILQQHKR